MRFLRIGEPGAETPAVLDDQGVARDLSRLATLSAADVATLPPLPDGGRIGACLSGATNIVAIGLNYAQHARETGADIPTEPVVFSKHTSAIGGPFDAVACPPGATKLDWEVELGVVIGRAAYRVARTEALSHVFGYCTVNDLSERDMQLRRGGQWIKGKSNPGFAPIGPWLVRADAVPDPGALGLRLAKNGEVRQDASTGDMIFDVPTIISYLSDFMRLIPGDLIITGTPAGIGSRQVPPNFLAPGDVVEAEVTSLGRQRIVIAAAASPSR
jgi:2,4-didehydro-3-deoxy-L-rhamnonate hydrolase